MAGGLNFILVIVVCCLPSLLIPYSAKKRKTSLRSPFTFLASFFEFLCLGTTGMFQFSIIKLEEEEEVYLKDGCMFGMAPHGTLPLSVWALFYQSSVLRNVCIFFGSQCALIPGYRAFIGLRGAAIPGETTRLFLTLVNLNPSNISLIPPPPPPPQ